MMTHSNIGRTVRGYRLFRTLLSMGVLCIGLLGFNASAMAAVTAKMTSPVANATAAEPGSFVLTATATSTGGTIKNVAFYSGTTLLNTDTTSPYTFTWNNVAAGTYVLKAKATDSKNATATSTTVTVTVTKVVKAYYIDVDHLNTPRAVTNSTGAAVWTWDNVDPYGANVPNENPGGLGAFAFNLRFPGQYFDKETSTHYNYFRDYDPAVGRYVESDLIGLDGGINGYVYALSNPLRYTDPLGLEVTMTCRSLSNPLSRLIGTPRHCSVVVWHWVNDSCRGRRKQVDSQFSLSFGGTAPTGDPNNQTYKDDRTAFNNPGGNNSNYDIPPPAGSTQSAFDNAVTNSGNNYSQGTYMPPGYGPNSNTAANNIITNAGGTTPDVPGAWGQNFKPGPSGPGPDISGGWGGY